LIGLGTQIDDAIMLCRLSRKHTIEPGPAVRSDFGIEATLNVEVASRSELKGDQVAGACAQPLADVVTRNDEVVAVVRNASDDDVEMRVLGVPVIDRDPVELGPEIPLRLHHQVARKGLQVGELFRIVRRYNEPEVMTIVGASFCEGAMVGVIAFGIEHAAGGSVSRDTVPAQVFEMRSERRSLDPVSYDAGLDHRTA
jgi:hypothetical protein